MFLEAQIIDNAGVYKGDKITSLDETLPGTDIQVIQTPGHKEAHASLVVPTDEGKVVIAGDVFWWPDEEKQIVDIEKEDPYASNMEALKESRKKVLEIADFIIPGHGKIFKVDKT